MPVVALALIEPSGRVLLQRQLPGKPHAGAWEFPGGKVEVGENPRDALVREIAEELGLTLDRADLCPGPFSEEAADRHIVLFLYTAHRWVGIPQSLEGQEWGWFSPQAARKLMLAPMDRDLMDRLLP